MSAITTNAPIETATVSPWKGRLDRVERWLAKIGDYLNPILVKETRQAIKSRQFGLTFVLLLALCWAATIGGVALVGPGIYYSASGGLLLKAYVFVLLFPLLVVVPFSAFRSLTGEREENTYDLLRVSTLTPHQIIRGKLGSAVVQMGVYLSAIAPCIAFTYLLRGVDVVMISMLLLYAMMASYGLCLVGLFAASLVQKKHGQVILSVGFVTLLLGCFWGGLAIANGFVDYSGSLANQSEFWPTMLMLLSIYVTTFLLLYLATVAMVSYSSENRSTPLRWAMLLQQTVFVGWMAFAWINWDYDDQMLFALYLVAAIYWYAFGTLLSTESGNLSHRARRQLPQSTLGRVFLAWFSPGPGTGYVFAIANLTTILVLGLIARWTIHYGQVNYHQYDFEQYVILGVMLWSYVVIYLGLGKLLTALIRRVAPVTGAAGFLIHVLLLLGATGIPYIFQMSSRVWRNAGFTPLQWFNPFWTIMNGPPNGPDDQLQAAVLLGVALCVLVINLPSVARELNNVRVALPTRVQEDEAELHPVIVKPQSPWDQDDDRDGKTASEELKPA